MAAGALACPPGAGFMDRHMQRFEVQGVHRRRKHQAAHARRQTRLHHVASAKDVHPLQPFPIARRDRNVSAAWNTSSAPAGARCSEARSVMSPVMESTSSPSRACRSWWTRARTIRPWASRARTGWLPRGRPGRCLRRRTSSLDHPVRLSLAAPDGERSKTDQSGKPGLPRLRACERRGGARQLWRPWLSLSRWVQATPAGEAPATAWRELAAGTD